MYPNPYRGTGTIWIRIKFYGSASLFWLSISWGGVTYNKCYCFSNIYNSLIFRFLSSTPWFMCAKKHFLNQLNFDLTFFVYVFEKYIKYNNGTCYLKDTVFVHHFCLTRLVLEHLIFFHWSLFRDLNRQHFQGQGKANLKWWRRSSLAPAPRPRLQWNWQVTTVE